MSREPSTARTLVIVASAIGAVAALYLIQVHVVVAAGATVGGLCDLSEVVNCEGTAASRFSTVLGVPIALLGLGWYLAAGALVLLAGRGAGEGAKALLSVGYGASVLYSVVLLVVSIGVIGSLCPACAVLYVCNTVAAFGAVRWAGGIANVRRGAFAASTRRALGLAAVVFGATVGVGLIVLAVIEAPPTPTAVVDAGDDDLRAEGAPFIGAPDAAVVVVEFSDFQCPYCSRFAQTLHELMDVYGDRVRLEFRHFPLDFHEYAAEAAAAAVCAQEQGFFWEMHDAMFGAQGSLDREGLVGLARAAGADADALEACLDAGDASAIVARDREAGLRLGVQGTPSFFINGRFHAGALPKGDVEALLEAALAP